MARYISLARPLRNDARGMLARNEDIEAVRASVREVLTTKLGERPNRPEFGSLLMTRVFELNDPVLEQLVRDDCATAIARCEPRVHFVDASIQREGRKLFATVRFVMRGDPNKRAESVRVELRTAA